MNVKRIRCFTLMNPRVRCFCISTRINNNNSAVTYNGPGYRSGSVPEETHAVVTQLFELPGVSEISLKSFEIHITLTPVVSWEEVREEILRALKHGFFDEEDDVEIVEGARCEGW